MAVIAGGGTGAAPKPRQTALTPWGTPKKTGPTASTSTTRTAVDDRPATANPPRPSPSAPATVSAPASSGDTAATGGSSDTWDELEKNRQDALAAQLDAIAANYGMTKEQLLADESEVGRQFRQSVAGLLRWSVQARKANLANKLERGVLRSGITNVDQQEIASEYDTRYATFEGDRQAQLAQIAAQRAGLTAQEAAEEAAARAASARTKLDIETMRAAYGL